VVVFAISRVALLQLHKIGTTSNVLEGIHLTNQCKRLMKIPPKNKQKTKKW
jgi:hypothetical protein